MRRQSHLPTLNEHDYFILPESVGRYWDFPEHDVRRSAGALHTFSIHYLAEGRGWLETEHEKIALGKGDAFLYFPLDAQRYYSDSEEPWTVLWTHFYGHTLKDYLLERGFRRSSVWTVRQGKGLEQALTECWRKRKSTPSSGRRAYPYLPLRCWPSSWRRRSRNPPAKRRRPPIKLRPSCR
ncbi:AraC family ligand binding domain-containing protein [Paenibacillus sp. P26]|nr:AraC family ligand binding domain-containing protein [Paenibacillus sp. P26]